MATAIGAYATLAGVKLNLGRSDAADDTLIQSICDSVNDWLESKTARILAPIPAFASTVASGSGATWTLASAAGVNLGDALMFGTVSGTHEHGLVAGIAGSVVTLQYALTNAYAASQPVVRVQLWDGAEALENGRMLPVPEGVNSVTSLEIAFYTGGAYNVIPMQDIFLRPTPLHREPGWPATEIWMTDVPTSGNPCPYFTNGIGNVRAVCAVGWPGVQDFLVRIANTVATSQFRLKGASGGDVTVGTDGERTFMRLLEFEDRQTLKRLTPKTVVII